MAEASSDIFEINEISSEIFFGNLKTYKPETIGLMCVCDKYPIIVLMKLRSSGVRLISNISGACSRLRHENPLLWNL